MREILGEQESDGWIYSPGRYPCPMMFDTDEAGGEDVLYAVCEAVADVADTDVRELPPLYETVDPEALDAFLRRSDGIDAHPERSVEFTYCDCRVAIDSTGRIELHPERDSTGAPPSA